MGGCTRLLLHQFRHLLVPSVQIVFCQRLLGTKNYHDQENGNLLIFYSFSICIANVAESARRF